MVKCVKQLLPFAVTPAAGTGGKGADTVQVCRTKPTFTFLRTNQSGADQAKLSVSTLVLEAHALSFTCRMSIPWEQFEWSPFEQFEWRQPEVTWLRLEKTEHEGRDLQFAGLVKVTPSATFEFDAAEGIC